MSANHGDRSHSVWSASASARNWACPGALRLTHGLPSPESEASAWGTACHQVSEKCLRTGVDAVVFLGTFETTKEHSIEVDDELAETAQTYVDFVRGVSTGDKLLFIEQRFDLARIDPPFEAGGTGDAVVYSALGKNLEIVDLKGGRGVVVEAEGNKQLRTYALGAMLANPDLDVETITATIVQPRAPHKNGRIRSETFHVADLMEWTAELLDAMHASKRAWDHDGPTGGEWAGAYLKPGNHCASTFCPARATCPAVQKASFDAVGLWFDDVTDKPHLHNTPDSLMPEQIAALLDAADMIEGYVKAVRAYAHNQAEGGVKIPNYILTQTMGREVWEKGTEATVQKAAAAAGLPDDTYLNPPKLRTPKQVRDAAKKAGVKEWGKFLTEHSVTPISGTALVREDRTDKPAAKPKAEQFFDALT